MATQNVIDEFVVKLGFDPTDFNKGRKAAEEEAKRTRDEMRKTARESEGIAKATANQINRITRELLLFFGVLTGARGIQQFVEQLTEANAQLGRVSTQLSESPQRMYAWGAAAERVGGSVATTSATFERLGRALHDFHYNAKLLPEEFSRIQAEAGRPIRTENGIDVFLQDTAAALKEIAKTNPSRAFFLAEGLGIDPATTRVMIQYGAAIGDYLKELEKSVGPTDEAIKAAQRLQGTVAKLQQEFAQFASVLVSKLQPVLERIVNKITEWFEKNGEWLSSGIVKAVEDFSTWLGNIPWDKVQTGATNFASAVSDITEAVGGLTTAIEALFALWLGSKFLKVLANARALAGASGGAAGAPAAGGGLLALLGKLSVWASLLLLSGDTPKDRKYTQEQLDRDTDEWTRLKGYDRPPGSGPTTRGRDRGLTERERSLDDFLNGGSGSGALGGSRGRDTLVEGRPVSRGNPMPVQIASSGGGSSGGGFFSRLGGLIDGIFGGGSTSGGGDTSGGGSFEGTGGSPGTGGAFPPPGSVRPGRGKAGAVGWWTEERQALAYKTLTEGGLSPAGAKGLISRWANVESTARGPSAINHIGATGIAQWLGSRKRNLMRFAKQRNKEWNDYETQLAFVLWELENDAFEKQHSAPYLKGAKTDEEGAIAATRYERAEGYNARRGIDHFTGKTLAGMRGMDRYVRGEEKGLGLGIGGPAQLSAMGGGVGSSSTTSNTFQVNKMDVHTQARDAQGLANGLTDAMHRAMKRSAEVTSLNTGLR